MASPASFDPADEQWLRDRSAAALARIDTATPARYRRAVPVPDTTALWAKNGFDAAGLAIVGPMGRGKTHLAWQAAKLWAAACLADPACRYLPTVTAHRATELFDALRPDAPASPYTVLEAAKTCGLFILDDVAAAKPTMWTQERLYELIDERYVEERPILITADVPPSKLADWTGPRVASRLTEMCTVQVLDGTDHRQAGQR
ncbi:MULTISPECIES: DnaA/Hda family protein [unclassified Streptomyces]|uniref:ATP-binding protein n=1 Tax=unclassified Streptomyces TaxID=2593676 RepID=UPI00340FB3FF